MVAALLVCAGGLLDMIRRDPVAHLRFPLTGVEVPVEGEPVDGVYVGAAGPTPRVGATGPADLQVEFLPARPGRPRLDHVGIEPVGSDDGTPVPFVKAGRTRDGLVAVLFETYEEGSGTAVVCLTVTGRFRGGGSCGQGPRRHPEYPPDAPPVFGASVYQRRDDRSSPPVVDGYVAAGPLPTGTATVELRLDGELVAWQRPRGGAALFPYVVSRPVEVHLVAKDATGAVVGETAWTVGVPPGEEPPDRR